MRNTIKEYIELSEDEKKALWKSATFVFDTNVFLNLYRYSIKTKSQLIAAFSELQPRIWMPYQVALEFCKNRYEVMNDADKRFEKLQTLSSNLIEDYKKELRIESNDEDLLNLNHYVKDWLEKKKKSNYQTYSIAKDEIFESILDLFENRVGQPFTIEEKSKIEKEGLDRYKKHIPPGYKDDVKQDNKYGDLFIWKEILNFAKLKQVDIIYVTHDQKDDWWNRIAGKTIGPRAELRREFYDFTNKKFHMYSMKSFLSFLEEEQSSKIDKATIDEIASIESHLNSPDSLSRKQAFLVMSEIEKTTSDLKNRINYLEAINRKREFHINTLQNKKSMGKLTPEAEYQLHQTIIKYNRCNEDIRELEKKLNHYQKLRYKGESAAYSF